MRTVDELELICDNCGYKKGFHRIDDSCPLGDYDAQNWVEGRMWRKTKFKRKPKDMDE